MMKTKAANGSGFIPRAEGVLLIQADNCNPNGDASDGRPRKIHEDDIGHIYNASTKHKVRQVINNVNGPIFQAICEKLELDPGRFRILEEKNRGFDDVGLSQVAANDRAINECLSTGKWKDKYWDARIFGLPPALKGLNQKYTGPVTFHDGFSIAPVQLLEYGGTRAAGWHEKPKSEKSKSETAETSSPSREKMTDSAGHQHSMIRHGLYWMPFSINCNSEGILCDANDIEVLKYVLPHIFWATSSTSRPSGTINLVKIYYAEHLPTPGSKYSLNSFRVSDWYNELRPKLKLGIKIPASLDDYIIKEANDAKTAPTIDLLDHYKL